MGTPKRALAAWIEAERDRKQWSVEELSRRLIDMGCDAKPGTIRVWEAPRGRPPQQATVEVMERLFGSQAPEAVSDNADLVAAIHKQAAAIDRLAAALERDREAAPGWAQAVVSAVLAGRQLLREDAEPDGPQGSGAPHRDRALA